MILRLTSKRFYKSLKLLLPFLFLFLALCFKLYHICVSIASVAAMDESGLAFGLRFSLDLCPYIFVFFLFYAYEACQSIGNGGLNETLRARKDALLRLYGTHFLILTGLSVVVYALFLGFTLYSCYRAGATLAIPIPSLPAYITLVLFLYVFLPALTASAMGMVLSALLRRLGAYMAMLLLTALVIASDFEGVAGLLAMAFGDKVSAVLDLFSLLPTGTQSRPVPQASVSVLPDRFFTPILLLSVFFLLLGLKLYFGRKTMRSAVLSAVSVLLCVTAAIQLALPASRINYNKDHPQGTKLSDAVNVGKEEVQPADFYVDGYDMQLKIGRELQAQVTVTLDNHDAAVRWFTLWHGYSILAVTDEHGTPLAFSQEGNYFSVTNVQGNSKITVQYRGHSNRFFANRQAVFLAGYFPYYPMPGKRALTNSINQYSFLNNTLGYATRFRVQVQGNQKMFSNIARVDDMTFEGEAQSVTLMAGFMAETTVLGVHLIYPYNTYVTSFFDEDMQKQPLENSRCVKAREIVQLMLSENVVQEGDCIVVAPSVGQQPYERFLDCTDTFFTIGLLQFESKESIEDLNIILPDGTSRGSEAIFYQVEA